MGIGAGVLVLLVYKLSGCPIWMYFWTVFGLFFWLCERISNVLIVSITLSSSWLSHRPCWLSFWNEVANYCLKVWWRGPLLAPWHTSKHHTHTAIPGPLPIVKQQCSKPVTDEAAVCFTDLPFPSTLLWNCSSLFSQGSWLTFVQNESMYFNHWQMKTQHKL